MNPDSLIFKCFKSSKNYFINIFKQTFNPPITTASGPGVGEHFFFEVMSIQITTNNKQAAHNVQEQYVNVFYRLVQLFFF